MGHTVSPAILAFSTSVSLPVPIEVQRLEYGHFVGSAGLHGHRFNEVMLFESAGDMHRIGDCQAETSVGLINAIGTGQVHNVELSRLTAGWMLLFPDQAIERTRLSPRVLDWFSRRGDDRLGRCQLSPVRRKRLALYFSTLESNQHAMSRDRESVTIALFSAILAELTTGHKLQRPAYAAFRHFEQLLDTIEEYYTQQLTLEQLADAVGLSKAYLTTELRQKTGRTAMQWVLDRRMKEARRLLFETDSSITHIAHDLGFEDSSHFARRFRAVHETSPVKWREAKQRSTK